MKKKTKKTRKDEKKKTRKKEIIERLDLIGFLMLALWTALRMRAVFVFPMSVVLLIFPFLWALITLIANYRLNPSERVSSYHFAYKTYWHPLCNLILSVSLIFLELPNEFLFFRSLNIIGYLLIPVVFIWSFVRWLRSPDDL